VEVDVCHQHGGRIDAGDGTPEEPGSKEYVGVVLSHPQVGTLDRLAVGAIAVNCGVLAWSLVPDAPEYLLEPAHDALVAFFAVEVAVRIVRARGLRGDRWLQFDLGVILVSLMPMLGVDATLLRAARLARLVHLSKHVTHLRLVRMVVGFGPRCYWCDERNPVWKVRIRNGRQSCPFTHGG